MLDEHGWTYVLLQCLFNWLHGFSAKTGGEFWFQRQAMMENLRYPRHGTGRQRRTFW